MTGAPRVPHGAGARDVAIIGMACVFPGARNLQAYWDNIIHKVNAVGEAPPEWEAGLFLDLDADTPDRLYCTRGGYLGALAEFNPTDYGIMPNSVDGTEPDHFLALRAAYDAIGDAGYLARPFDRERTEVIVGRGTYVNRGNTTVIQHGVVVDSVLRILHQLHPEHTKDELAAIKRELTSSLPAFHAETAPGLVPNIISGRIANRLDLMGSNYVIDAACASSLIALDLGMADLLNGRCDLAIVGGVHASTPPPIVMIFCQLKAISKRGEIRPFDSRADGTLLGEGVGMVALKRRGDAERDGDRIYAIVKGVGTASDGRALGLLAPRREGEELALRRAYEAAGVSPASVGLLEAHGTATPVGDVVEMEALNHVFGPREHDVPTCAIGSVKSMISHLMPASGVAGLIKAALALHHQVLPPTINCEEPNPRLGLEASRFYLNTETRPWIHGSPDAPRRAGVNAFGFGGINAHAVLEEYTGQALHPPRLQHRWDTEVFIVSADSRGEMIAQGERVLRLLEHAPDTSLRQLAYTLNASGEPGAVRLALVAGSTEDLAGKLKRALDRLRGERCQRIRDIEGIYFFETPLAHDGKLAFVFPGEGSQYPNMLADLAVHFPEVRGVFDFLDRAFAAHPRGYLPSDIIFPPPRPGGTPCDGRIYQMDSGAEAVFTANQAIGALLQALGIVPHAMVGHSTGEHSALLVSGLVRPEDEAGLIDHILQVNAIFEQLHTKGEIPHGVLVAVGGVDAAALRTIVARTAGRVHIAMDNCPHQTVLCGAEESMAPVVEALQAERGICQTLPFARAYHTPLFEVFCEPMREYLKRVKIRQTDIQLYSCVTAERYPAAADAIREIVATQWARTVRFRETIEAMYRDGVRMFVEAGPRATLSGFIDDVLRGKPHVAIPANVQHRSGVTQLNHLVGELAAHAMPIRLSFLYERREPERLDLDAAGRGSKARARVPTRLATGLQPMRLPPDFSLPRAKTKRGSTVEPALGNLAGQGPPAVAGDGTLPLGRTASGPVSTAAAPVIARHFKTMEEFLTVQAQVMNRYLASRPSSGGVVPLSGAPMARSAAPRAPAPFVQTVTEFASGKRATMTRRFDLDEDRLFQHHTLGRDVSADDRGLLALPVVPMTVTMEVLAETAALLMPDQVLIGMRNVRASRWITLEEGAATLEVSARADAAVAGEVVVTARERRSDGTAAPIVAEATIRFARAYPSPSGLGSFALKGERPSGWRTEQLYREGMFHGPCFQTVKAVARYGEDGTVAHLDALPRTELFRSNRDPQFLMDPIVLDGAGQVLAYWVKERLGLAVDVFPYGLEDLRCYGPPPEPGTSLECRVRAELIGSTQTRCDIEIVDPSGALLYELKGWQDRRFELPRELLRLRISPREAELARSWDAPIAGLEGAEALACCRVEGLGEEALGASHGLWLKMLAHLILSRRERVQWAALTGVPKRRCETLLGRAAAKDAVRRLLRAQFGLAIPPADVEILPDAYGRPEVHGTWCAGLGVTPVVSIAHSGGVAVALAALDGRPLVGIDIERMSDRNPGFERLAFAPEEQRLVSSLDEESRREWHLRFWCAKEAVGKALGRGLAPGLQSLQITDARLASGAVRVKLGAALGVEFPAIDGRELVTFTAREGDYVSCAIACV